MAYSPPFDSIKLSQLPLAYTPFLRDIDMREIKHELCKQSHKKLRLDCESWRY